MSSTSSSSSSSSSSTSTPYDAVAPDIPGPSTRRTGQFEGPSSSRQRAMNEVLPEPFLEALANQLALDAANYNGRLAAAPALANLFQVLSLSFYLFPFLIFFLFIFIFITPHLAFVIKNMQSLFVLLFFAFAESDHGFSVCLK